MPQENLTSSVIANLNATPVTRMAMGEGGTGDLVVRTASLQPTNGLLSTSTYRFTRLRNDEILGHIYVKADTTSATLTGNWGFYYSNSTTDGTQPQNQGNVINSTFVVSNLVMTSMTTFTDLTQYITAANLQKPLWSALGLTATTGGYFDLVMVNTTTNVTTSVLMVETQTYSSGAAS